jgi:AhpD family alkylhydroperoxidase
MESRLNPYEISPDGYRAMSGLQKYVNGSGLEPRLLELVKLRASQINGCAYCIALHVREARALGETDERMHLLNAWHEAPIFTPREQAALAWTESLTLVSETRVPDEVYERVRRHFGDKEIVDLSFAVVTINSWNRLSVAFRRLPDTEAPRTP